MLKKNKQHFIGIAVETPDGKKDGYNLQAKNDRYKALLAALEGVTGLKTEEETEEKKEDDKKKEENKKTISHASFLSTKTRAFVPWRQRGHLTCFHRLNEDSYLLFFSSSSIFCFKYFANFSAVLLSNANRTAQS